MSSSTGTPDRRATNERRSQTGEVSIDRRRARADRRASENRLIVCFKIGEQALAVDVLRVQEIIQPQVMTPIPTADEHIAGLINLRGQIVTAIDLRQLLGMPARESCSECMNLVVHTDDGPVSLLFDVVGDVLEVARHMIEPTPVTLDPALREYVEAVVKQDDDLLMVLDIDACVMPGGSTASA